MNMKMYEVHVGYLGDAEGEVVFEFLVFHSDPETLWKATEQMIDSEQWCVLSVEEETP